MMRAFRTFFLLLLLLAVWGTASAEVVVVVDARSTVDSITQEEVVNIFLGRRRVLPNGEAALPVEPPVTDPVRAEFYRKLVDKSLAQVSAYWASLYFSGKTRPPLQAESASGVADFVTRRPGGIGYLKRSEVNARLRIVLTLPQ